MSNALKKTMLGTLAIAGMMAMATGTPLYDTEFNRQSRKGPSTPPKLQHSTDGGDHSHLLTQPKKLRKGSGSKKLTRAQRKKMRYMDKKRKENQ